MTSFAKNIAIKLLARREHSFQELVNKLISREIDEKTAMEVGLELKEQGLQSDERFAEHFVRSQCAKSYGPIVIKYKLEQHKISGELINQYLTGCECDWSDLAKQLALKRIGRTNKLTNLDKNALMKLKRYLYTKGFSADHINDAITEQ